MIIATCRKISKQKLEGQIVKVPYNLYTGLFSEKLTFLYLHFIKLTKNFFSAFVVTSKC